MKFIYLPKREYEYPNFNLTQEMNNSKTCHVGTDQK